MDETTGQTQERAEHTCSYCRRDGSFCPELPVDSSPLCFWHSGAAEKSDEDVKAKLEAKVKEDKNCEGYRLEKVNLFDGWLIEANFNDAILRKANLSKGHLFGISLEGADLFKANLSGANLRHANLNDANLMGVNIENARLGNIEWGQDNIVLQEKLANIAQKQGRRQIAREHFKDAEEIYIELKNHFNLIGQSKMVGKFFYREMIAHRKQVPIYKPTRFFMKMADVSCGYGEKVGNIFLFSLLVIILNAVIYSFSSITDGENLYRLSLEHGFLGNVKLFFLMLYYSTVTFTTLGYGDYAPASPVSKFFAGTEAFLGAFLVALFVITVYKNLMSR